MPLLPTHLVYPSLSALHNALAQNQALNGLCKSELNQTSPTSLRIQLLLPQAQTIDHCHFDLYAYQYLLVSALKVLPVSPITEARYLTHKDGSLDLSWQSEDWTLSITIISSALDSTEALLLNGEVQAIPRDSEASKLISISSELAHYCLNAMSLSQRAQRFGIATQSAQAQIHETAIIHPTVDINGAVTVGANTKIWHFSKLLGPVNIGEDCSFGQNVVIERGVEIGRNVKVQNNVSIYAGVILEDDVFCGPSMVFTNVGTPRSHYPRRNAYSVTRIGKGASIGANATIVCGHSLGRYAFVGAGAVVTKDIPDFALVYGNPARIHGWACYCGVRLQFHQSDKSSEEHQFAKCTECSREYELKDEQIIPLSPLDQS